MPFVSLLMLTLLLLLRIAKGFCVGLVSLGLSLRLGLTLILFYKSSSVLTKVGSKKKRTLTDDYKVKSPRRMNHTVGWFYAWFAGFFPFVEQKAARRRMDTVRVALGFSTEGMNILRTHVLAFVSRPSCLRAPPSLQIRGFILSTHYKQR